MFKALSIGGLGTIALVAALATVRLSSPPQAKLPDGHLVLILEGDVNALRITQVVAKKDPCGPTNTIDSDYHLVVHRADQSTIASYPLDLSQFDLNPQHAGQPLRVEGCAIVDTKIAMLANLPFHPDATSISITGPGRMIGELSIEAYTRLVTAAVSARSQR